MYMLYKNRSVNLNMDVHTYMQSFICISKVKLATIVEGDSKAPFSIAYYTKV